MNLIAAIQAALNKGPVGPPAIWNDPTDIINLIQQRIHQGVNTLSRGTVVAQGATSCAVTVANTGSAIANGGNYPIGTAYLHGNVVGKPTGAAQSALGSGGSVAIDTNALDTRGILTLNTGSGSIAAGTVAHVTYHNPFYGAPIVVGGMPGVPQPAYYTPGTPTAAADTAMGSGGSPNATVGSGSDIAAGIGIHTGSTGLGSGPLVDVTFGVTMPHVPVVVVVWAGTPPAATLTVASVTATHFVIDVSAALAPNASLSISYTANPNAPTPVPPAQLSIANMTTTGFDIVATGILPVSTALVVSWHAISSAMAPQVGDSLLINNVSPGNPVVLTQMH